MPSLLLTTPHRGVPHPPWRGDNNTMQNYTVRLDTRVRPVQSRINPIISILPYYSKTITLERGDAALVFHPSHPKRDRIRHVLPCACIPQTRFCGPVSVRSQLLPNFTQKCRPHQTQQATNKVAAEAGEAAEAKVPINGATRKRMRIPRHRYRTSRHRHCSHLERREAQRMRRPSTLPN